MKGESPSGLQAALVLTVPRVPLEQGGVQGRRTPGRGQFGWGIVCSAGWSSITGLSSFLRPFKCRAHPSTTTKGNWVAGSHVKAELGQAQSMFRPSAAAAPRQPGPLPAFLSCFSRLRLLLWPGPGRSLSLPCTSQARKAVMSAADMATVWWPSRRLNVLFLPAPPLASPRSPECAAQTNKAAGV